MKRKQGGFGLVEMLVALVIGLVLLLGLSSILISMTRTAELRRKMAETQSGQRVALSMIGNALRYAGAFPYAEASTVASVFPAAGVFGVGQSLVGSGANENADTVSVRFVASDSASASQGCSAQLTAGHTYTNVFSVSDGYLTCVETDVTAASDPTTAKLVGGLAGMNLVYGVDATGAGFTTQYLAAADAGLLWDKVKTVRVTLIFTNPLAGQAGQARTPTVSVSQTIPHTIGL